MTTPAPTATPRASSVGQLAQMQLRSTEDLHVYVVAARRLAVSFGTELEGTAAELLRALGRGPRHAAQNLARRQAARRVIKHFNRAAAHQAASANSLARGYREYLNVFSGDIEPGRESWKFQPQGGGRAPRGATHTVSTGGGRGA